MSKTIAAGYFLYEVAVKVATIIYKSVNEALKSDLDKDSNSVIPIDTRKALNAIFGLAKRIWGFFSV